MICDGKKLLVLEQPRQEHYRSGLSDGDQRLQFFRSGLPSDRGRACKSFTASRIFSKRQQAKATATFKAVSPVAEKMRDRIFQISAETRDQRKGYPKMP